MKILIVDDSSIITTSFRKFLEIKKHECKVANNGIDGLRLILDESFDVVLLDVHMPGMTGTEVLEKLTEKNISLSNIIVLSASIANDKEKHHIYDLGVSQILKKPISIPNLLSTLDGIQKQLVST